MKRLSKLLIVLTLIFVLTVPVFAQESSERPIVIQGAMDMEVEMLVSSLEDPREITYGSWTFWEGKLYGLPVVVSRTEVGITNAAAATVVAIEKFHPRAIINQGTSGGHDPELHRFDIVLGEKAINYGKFRSNHKDYGEGTDPTSWIPENVSLRVDGEKKYFPGFKGHPVLLKAAQDTASQYEHGKVVKGTIGTADEWNRELDRIKWLHENIGTSVEEMETASAAQVAGAYNVPFLGIRILSNSEPQNEAWDPKAADYCQEFVLQVIKTFAEGDYDLTSEPKLFVGGKEIELKNLPMIEKETIYLPVREVFSVLGGDVTWNNDTGSVEVVIEGKTIPLSNKNGILKEGVFYISTEEIAKITSYHLTINDTREVRFYKIQEE